MWNQHVHRLITRGRAQTMSPRSVHTREHCVGTRPEQGCFDEIFSGRRARSREHDARSQSTPRAVRSRAAIRGRLRNPHPLELADPESSPVEVRRRRGCERCNGHGTNYPRSTDRFRSFRAEMTRVVRPRLVLESPLPLRRRGNRSEVCSMGTFLPRLAGKFPCCRQLRGLLHPPVHRVLHEVDEGVLGRLPIARVASDDRSLIRDRDRLADVLEPVL